MHKHAFTLVVIRVGIWDIGAMTFSNRTHFYLTGTSGTAYENIFIIVIKHVSSRIVTDLTDSCDKCRLGFRES